MDPIVRQAKDLPAAAFVAEHPGFFLVTSEDPEDLPKDFQTTKGTRTRTGAPMRNIERLHILSLGPAIKSGVSIGREDCDLVLHHPSVSGRHAEIRLQPTGRIELCDRSSKNATRVNGHWLKPEHWHPVAVGDVVHLGDLPLVLLDAVNLHDMIH